jgi:hypothetical protein
MKRWVGLGVIADNLVNISRAMANQPGRLAGPSVHSKTRYPCRMKRAP